MNNGLSGIKNIIWALAIVVALAAVLVGLSNSPSAYDPIRKPEAARDKRNDVLHSMLEVGYLTKEQYDSSYRVFFLSI